MDILETFSRSTMSEDKRDGRVYGFVYGVVTDVDTSQVFGRIKARVGAQGDNESTDWIDPAWPGSIESVPVVGQPVFVAFVDGDPHRGLYFWHPTSKTKNRAKEHILLGDTLTGMFNFFVDQFNQLRTDFNSHTQSCSGTITGTANLTTGAVTGSYTGTASAPSPTTAIAANKGKASDGSVIANKATSEVVLSGKALVNG